MDKKEAYETKLQSQLDEWNARIDQLKARADAARADAQVEYLKQIEQLRIEQRAATRKLEELRAAGDDAWQDLKGGIERAWDSLGESIRSAASRFS